VCICVCIYVCVCIPTHTLIVRREEGAPQVRRHRRSGAAAVRFAAAARGRAGHLHDARRRRGRWHCRQRDACLLYRTHVIIKLFSYM